MLSPFKRVKNAATLKRAEFWLSRLSPQTTEYRQTRTINAIADIRTLSKTRGKCCAEYADVNCVACLLKTPIKKLCVDNSQRKASGRHAFKNCPKQIHAELPPRPPPPRPSPKKQKDDKPSPAPDTPPSPKPAPKPQPISTATFLVCKDYDKRESK